VRRVKKAKVVKKEKKVEVEDEESSADEIPTINIGGEKIVLGSMSTEDD